MIVDEAGNSPAWLPFLGLGLLALLALLIAVHHAIGGGTEAAPAAEAAAAAPEAAAAQPEPSAPQAPAAPAAPSE